MTLRDIGFKKEDIKVYLLLEQIGVSTVKERLEILEVKRSAILDEMHKKEKQLECLDYLRYKIKKIEGVITMKKIFYFILAAIAAVSMTACANNEMPFEADISTSGISAVLENFL